MFHKVSILFSLSIILVVSGVLLAPCSRAADDFDIGMEAAKMGQFDQAVELWTRFIQKNPKSYSAHVNRGSAYLKSGYVFKGIMDWHQARKLSPLFAFGVYGQDFIAQASGDTSMLNYASPLELDPDHISSVAMMGIAYLDLGQPAKAVQLYRKAMDLTKNPLLKSYLDHWADTIESSAKQ
jgi:tetratricopeptide (TPR) repeat protein